jgi:NAD(P)-dependent dehydrogenase (short-subunit alcohol dehydrogenase family)
MPPAAQALRLGGAAVMAYGSWKHRPATITLGVAAVAAGWSHGLDRSNARKDELPHRPAAAGSGRCNMDNAYQQVALVTGVSSGIGRATAEVLASREWRTFGTVRRPARGPAGVELLPLDVRDAGSVESCVQAVLHAAGRIDLLVNNAGVALYGALEETSVEEAQALFDTNVFGVMRMTQAVLPAMRRQGAGRIVTIGSVAGFVPIPYDGIYVAAKHALEGWAETLAYEVERFGIRVVLIEPGYIHTDLDRNVSRARSSIPAYAEERRRAEAGMARKVAHGEEPSVVAETVWRAVTSARPRMRYLAGREARLVRMLRLMLPSSLFSIGFRRSMRTDLGNNRHSD